MSNRIIKFRAWDNSQMLNMPIDTYFGISKFFGFISDDAILMQFSGLYDSYNREIYEGDILELTNSSGKLIRVVCNFGSVERQLMNLSSQLNICQITGFYFMSSDKYPTFPIVKNYVGVNDLKIMEIVGNVYEHPELLK